MKLLILALIVPSLMVLSSCSTEPKIEYVDRIIYKTPIYPVPQDTELPSVQLNVWGDYGIYKAQCESLINKCNTDKKSIIDALKIPTEQGSK